MVVEPDLLASQRRQAYLCSCLRMVPGVLFSATLVAAVDVQIELAMQQDANGKLPPNGAVNGGADSSTTATGSELVQIKIDDGTMVDPATLDKVSISYGWWWVFPACCLIDKFVVVETLCVVLALPRVLDCSTWCAMPDCQVLAAPAAACT